MTGLPSTNESDLREIDPRNLCGFKGCMNKAIALWAWPLHYPVPLCPNHRAELIALVEAMEHRVLKPYSPAQWGQYLREVGRPQIVRVA